MSYYTNDESLTSDSASVNRWIGRTTHDVSLTSDSAQVARWGPAALSFSGELGIKVVRAAESETKIQVDVPATAIEQAAGVGWLLATTTFGGSLAEHVHQPWVIGALGGLIGGARLWNRWQRKASG